jgi:Protein of unknown function (DUF3325)
MRMTALAALLLNLGGFACTVLSMPKHHREVFGTPLSRRAAQTWRMAGWVSLSIAIALCVINEGPAIGTVAWTGLLTVAALLVTMLLTYLPHAIAIVVFTAPLLAVVLLAVNRVAL